MKDQHYSMKDPSDWTNEDMEMYKRDQSRIEYTEEQIKQIENELDYEQYMKDKTMTTPFKELNKIDVNQHTEKKGRFTYLSWAWAWQQLLARYPDSTRTVYENTYGQPYVKDTHGVMVKVGVTVNGIEHIEYLPVMNHQNRCIPVDKANMMDINKAIQRCTVKAIARHGLGLYIYAGEDLPDSDTESKPEPKKQTWESLATSPPQPEKPELLPDTQRFELCKNWLQKPANTIQKLRERYTISKEVEQLLLK